MTVFTNINQTQTTDTDIDVEKIANVDLSNLSDTGENHFANKSLSNIDSVAKAQFLNTQMITNCLISASSGLVTVSGNVFTIPGGLIFLIPDGTNPTTAMLKTIKIVTSVSETFTETSSNTGNRKLFYKNDNTIVSYNESEVHYNNELKLWQLTESGVTTQLKGFCLANYYWDGTTVSNFAPVQPAQIDMSSDTYADVDFQNITDSAKNIGHWSSNVTNCITEIPEIIHTEFDSVAGTITLKAGSEIYYPDSDSGSVKKLVLDHDLVSPIISAESGNSAIQVRNLYLMNVSTNPSIGYTNPMYFTANNVAPDSCKAYNLCYDYHAHKIYQANSTGSAWSVADYSFPFMQVEYQYGKIVRRLEIYNAIIPFGSYSYSIPGVTISIPNGSTPILTQTFGDDDVQNDNYTRVRPIFFDKDAGLDGYGDVTKIITKLNDITQSSTELCYDSDYNRWYYHSATSHNWSAKNMMIYAYVEYSMLNSNFRWNGTPYIRSIRLNGPYKTTDISSFVDNYSAQRLSGIYTLDSPTEEKLKLQSRQITNSVTPSEILYDNYIDSIDTDGNLIGRIFTSKDTNGNNYQYLQAWNGSTNYTLGISSGGSVVVSGIAVRILTNLSNETRQYSLTDNGTGAEACLQGYISHIDPQHNNPTVTRILAANGISSHDYAYFDVGIDNNKKFFYILHNLSSSNYEWALTNSILAHNGCFRTTTASSSGAGAGNLLGGYIRFAGSNLMIMYGEGVYTSGQFVNYPIAFQSSQHVVLVNHCGTLPTSVTTAVHNNDKQTTGFYIYHNGGTDHPKLNLSWIAFGY